MHVLQLLFYLASAGFRGDAGLNPPGDTRSFFRKISFFFFASECHLCAYFKKEICKYLVLMLMKRWTFLK